VILGVLLIEISGERLKYNFLQEDDKQREAPADSKHNPPNSIIRQAFGME
jgi:hypothetical protein